MEIDGATIAACDSDTADRQVDILNFAKPETEKSSDEIISKDPETGEGQVHENTLATTFKAPEISEEDKKQFARCVAQVAKERDSANNHGAETMKNKEKLDGETKNNSLSIIASAYDSDSEEEAPEAFYEDKNVTEEPQLTELRITAEYRRKVIALSSDEDSDSSDSDSSDDSKSSSSKQENESSDAEVKDCPRKTGRNNKQNGPQEKEMKGEYDDLPPIEKLEISVPEVLCDPLGEVGWMVEQMVVVKPKPGKPTLNLDTILFVERGRRVLGRIFDVFGQVADPHYCVRFNSSEHIKESDIKPGMSVYFCPNTEYTSVVFLQDLLKMKAADEIDADEHPEFSDDEEERAYYAALRQKQKNEKAKTSDGLPQKRQKTNEQKSGWKSKHPWNTAQKPREGNKNVRTGQKSDWPPKNSQQNIFHHANNSWQYPAYPGNPWPNPEAYRWPSNSQPPHGYQEEFQGAHGDRRAFFRPPAHFQPPHDYPQNRPPFHTLPNSPRYPVTNFSPPTWPSPSWPTPPPPPPPPGI